MAAAIIFLLIPQFASDAFIVFIIYAGALLVCSLAIYLNLPNSRKLRGAAVIAAGIVINLAAAAVQTSDASAIVVLPLDHNGLFHLVARGGVLVIAGLGMQKRQGKSTERAARLGPDPSCRN